MAPLGPVAETARSVGAETHQLFELALTVAELLVHAEAHLRALQGGDDLQLRVFVLDDVVLQHQTQDLRKTSQERHQEHKLK